MKIVQVVASVNANTGGPSQSVALLSRYMAAQGADVRLMTMDYTSLGAVQPLGSAKLALAPAGFAALRFRGFSPRFASQLHAAAADCDVIHNHGLWMWPNVYARVAAVRSGRPLVISPRGMLEPWALKRGRLKKAVFWQLFEAKNLSQAAIFHATSPEEATHIRLLKLTQPIAVIPNAVELPTLELVPDRGLLEALHPAIQGKRWLLFLSRLHIKKGIRELLTVWREIHQVYSDWQLIIAGDVTGGYGIEIQDQIRHRLLPDSVTVVGHLAGQLKAIAMRHADLFVLPSFSENFGIAVAEALAHATPVVTTSATPWKDLPSTGAGWCIQPGVEPLRETLPIAMSQSTHRLAQMGVAGRQLIASRHNWEKVACDMTAAYQWLISKDRGYKPDFVIDNDMAA